MTDFQFLLFLVALITFPLLIGFIDSRSRYKWSTMKRFFIYSTNMLVLFALFIFMLFPLEDLKNIEFRAIIVFGGLIVFIIFSFYIVLKKNEYKIEELREKEPIRKKRILEIFLISISIIVFLVILVVKISPQDARFYYYRGLAYDFLLQKDYAAKDFDKSIKLGIRGKKGANAFSIMGSYYLDKNEKDKAFECYNKAIDNDPNNEDNYISRGLLFHNYYKDLKKALEDYNRAIELKNDIPIYYDQRGKLYIDLNQFQKAIDDLTYSLEIGYDRPETLNSRGVAYIELGLKEEALKDFSQAIKIKPSYYLAYRNRAFLYKELGMYKEAIEDFKKVIEINPNDELTQLQLKALGSIEK